MRRLVLIAGALGLATGGVATAQVPIPPILPPTTTTTTTTTMPTIEVPRQGRLVITKKKLESDRAYFEGAVPFVEVADADGETVIRRKGDITTKRRLPAGRYTLTSFVRPCEGNCNRLDPPTDRCSRSFRLKPVTRIKAQVLIKPGYDCRVDLDRPD